MLVDIYKDMLQQLKDNRLEVKVGKAHYNSESGVGIREVVSENCEWYRDLCSRYSSNRGLKGSRRRNDRKKHQTKIKRQYIALLLQKLILGVGFESKYKQDLIEIANNQKDIWEDIINSNSNIWDV